MKSSASKRVLFLIIFLFVLLLGGVAYYFKDVISNGIKYGRWFTVDKHEELFDYCDWERKGNNLDIKCKALVEKTSVKEGSGDLICYSIKIISIKDSNLVDYDFCDDPKSIEFMNPYFSIKNREVLPIDLIIVNKGSSFKGYSFIRMDLDAVSQKVLEGWLQDDNLKNNLESSKIRLLTNMSYNNFSLTESNLFPNTSLNLIRLYQVKLENISSNEYGSRLEFSGFFADGTKPFKLILNTKGFAYSEIYPNRESTSYLEKESVNLLQINKVYDVDLIYGTKDILEEKTKLKEVCSLEDDLTIQRKSFCSLIENDINIEPYSSIQTSDDFVKFVTNNFGIVSENFSITHVLNLGENNNAEK